jgi:DNA-directed RNA polymerase I subunit RPA2
VTRLGGEYCRVCQEWANNDGVRSRSQNSGPAENRDITIALPSDHVLGGQPKSGDLDIIAVPFVFRYLCAELASMGIAVALEVR